MYWESRIEMICRQREIMLGPLSGTWWEARMERVGRKVDNNKSAEKGIKSCGNWLLYKSPKICVHFKWKVHKWGWKLHPSVVVKKYLGVL